MKTIILLILFAHFFGMIVGDLKHCRLTRSVGPAPFVPTTSISFSSVGNIDKSTYSESAGNGYNTNRKIQTLKTESHGQPIHISCHSTANAVAGGDHSSSTDSSGSPAGGDHSSSTDSPGSPAGGMSGHSSGMGQYAPSHASNQYQPTPAVYQPPPAINIHYGTMYSTGSQYASSYGSSQPATNYGGMSPSTGYAPSQGYSQPAPQNNYPVMAMTNSYQPSAQAQLAPPSNYGVQAPSGQYAPSYGAPGSNYPQTNSYSYQPNNYKPAPPPETVQISFNSGSPSWQGTNLYKGSNQGVNSGAGYNGGSYASSYTGSGQYAKPSYPMNNNYNGMNSSGRYGPYGGQKPYHPKIIAIKGSYPKQGPYKQNYPQQNYGYASAYPRSCLPAMYGTPPYAYQQPPSVYGGKY